MVKVLDFFTIFQDKESTEAYAKIREPALLRFIKVFTFFGLIASLLVLIDAVINSRDAWVIEGSLMLGFLLLLAVILIFCQDTVRPYMSLLLVACFIMLMHRYIKLKDEEVSSDCSFYIGYTIAIGQQMLVAQLNSQITIIISELAISIFRMSLIGIKGANRDFYIHVGFSILSLLFSVQRERKSRKVFLQFFNFDNQQQTFKALINDYLPQSTFIIDKSKRYLYQNLNHRKNFNIKNIPNATSYLQQLMIESESSSIPKNNYQNSTNHSSQQYYNGSNISQSFSKSTKNHQHHTQNDNLAYNSNQSASALNISFESDIIRDKQPDSTFKNLNDLIDNMFLHYENIEDNFVCFQAKYSIFDEKVVAKKQQNDSQPEEKILSITISSIRWDDTKSLVIFIHDMTPELAQSKLKASNVNLDKIVSSVSHELRNPLANILGGFNILLSKIKSEEYLKDIEILKQNCQLLDSIVRSFLDISLIKNGKFDLRQSQISLNSINEQIQSLFKYDIEVKGLELKAIIDDGVPSTIINDKDRLLQILINLIGNSIKFTTKGGITLQYKQHQQIIDEEQEQQEYIRIEIIDTGEGMSKESQKRLFRRYGKLEDQKGRNRQGIGLGLSIANELSKLIGKSQQGIQVKSELGKGSTFYFDVLKELEEENCFDEDQTDNYAKFPTRKVQFHTRSNQKQSLLNTFEKQQISNDDIILDTNLKATRENNCEKEPLKIDNEPNEFSEPNYFFSPQSSSNSQPHSQISKLHSISSNVISQEKQPIIMIADDNAASASFLKAMINQIASQIGFSSPIKKQTGFFKIVHAQNGQEVIDFLIDKPREASNIKLAILDLEMPLLSGKDTAKKIQSMVVASKTLLPFKIYGYSGNFSDSEKKECIEAGMLDVFLKPMTSREVEQLLREYE